MKVVARFQEPVTLAYLAPDVVVCEIKDPAGTVSTPAAIYDAALATADGITGAGYYVEVDVEMFGTWYYRFEATGSGQAAEEGDFYVERSNFP